jgi:hypothetical protein
MSAPPITGEIGYHAGTSGAVTLGPTEKVLHIRALGASGATLTIDGGDVIPIPASYVFDDGNDSRCEEYTGVVLTFDSTLSFYVKTKTPRA